MKKNLLILIIIVIVVAIGEKMFPGFIGAGIGLAYLLGRSENN